MTQTKHLNSCLPWEEGIWQILKSQKSGKFPLRKRAS